LFAKQLSRLRKGNSTQSMQNSVDDAAFAGIWDFNTGVQQGLRRIFRQLARLKARNNA